MMGYYEMTFMTLLHNIVKYIHLNSVNIICHVLFATEWSID